MIKIILNMCCENHNINHFYDKHFNYCIPSLVYPKYHYVNIFLD